MIGQQNGEKIYHVIRGGISQRREERTRKSDTLHMICIFDKNKVNESFALHHISHSLSRYYVIPRIKYILLNKKHFG
jgi:hypothetical protein